MQYNCNIVEAKVLTWLSTNYENSTSALWQT